MCILGSDWSLKIPRLPRTLHSLAKTVKEMSDSIRERAHEFSTVPKTNLNGQETKLNLSQNNKTPIYGEIMFSLQPNHMHAIKLNPDSMIALLDINGASRDHRARLEKELESCSAKHYPESNSVQKSTATIPPQ